MIYPKAIIFGANGAVGKAAAAEAHRRGARLTLALRDISKSVPGLSDVSKVKADLSDPASIQEAIRESGSTTAFVYTMDYDMTPTFKAMKEAGITYIVLLSSWTIYPLSLEDAAESHVIPAKHAKAELALGASGIPFSAVRPLYFASNVLHSAEDIKKGQVDVCNENGVWDYISPEDIGVVAGAKLFSEPEIVPIIGARLIPQKEAWQIIGRELNREIKVNGMDYDEFVRTRNVPGKYAVSYAKGAIRTDKEKYPEDRRKVALENIRKYTGREPTTFEDWLKAHREDFHLA